MLIDALIALLILAIISVPTYGVLNSWISTSELSTNLNNQTQIIQTMKGDIEETTLTDEVIEVIIKDTNFKFYRREVRKVQDITMGLEDD